MWFTQTCTCKTSVCRPYQYFQPQKKSFLAPIEPLCLSKLIQTFHFNENQKKNQVKMKYQERDNEQILLACFSDVCHTQAHFLVQITLAIF